MIRLLVLDVDGTMTDGGVYYDSAGNELKKFAIKDGAGIVLARAAGMQVMICTGRECEAVRRRAQDLHIDYLFQNVHDKAAFLSRFMAEHSLTKQDVAYCGDDLNDLTAMALCGFVACPADAAGPVLGRADFICRQKAARALCAARWKRSCCGTAACLPPLKSLWRKDLMGAAETLNIPVFVLDTP